MLCVLFHRYIDCVNTKVMQDIISSKLYTEQFDAIQDCFRIIGFTEEVMWNHLKTCIQIVSFVWSYYFYYNVFVAKMFLLFYIQEVNSVYRILAAILNTGNIEFTSTTSQHQSDMSEVPNSEALDNGTSLNDSLIS